MRLNTFVATAALLAGVMTAAPARAQDPAAKPEPEQKQPPTQRREARIRVQIGPDGQPDVVVERDGTTTRPLSIRTEAAARKEKGAFLGVATSPPGRALREQLKLQPGTGLVVDLVEQGSPADQAGLEECDVLTKFADQLLVNPDQLAVLVRTKRPGDEVDLGVIRGGAPTTVKAKLVERELSPLEDVLFDRGNRGAVDTDVLRLLPPEARDALQRHVRQQHGEHAHAEPHHAHGEAGVRSVTKWTDGEHVLSITTEPGTPGRKLVAKDKSGAAVFEGDIDDAAARESMPAAVKEKLKKMEEAGVKPPKAERQSEH